VVNRIRDLANPDLNLNANFKGQREDSNPKLMIRILEDSSNLLLMGIFGRNVFSRDGGEIIKVNTLPRKIAHIGRGIEQLPAWLAWGVPLLHKPTS
jgi:hypothetical protein